jgi:MFS family permease
MAKGIQLLSAICRLFEAQNSSYGYMMKTETSYPTLMIYPRRGLAVLWAAGGAVILSVAFGGLLASLLGGGWASLMTFVYLVLFAIGILGFRRGWLGLVAAMRPVVELNNEELIDLRTERRIAWASIVELSQRRVAGRWVIDIDYLDEDDPDRLDSYDLPLSGYHISGRRLGAEIRKRFDEVDAGDALPDTENPATLP